MEIDSLCDQGSSKAREDGYFVTLPFVGVMDGVSDPHDRDHPQVKFRDGRLTGGEATSRIIEEFFIQRSTGQDAATQDLRDLILEANQLVGNEFKDHGFSLDSPETLPGATFAIAKIDEKRVEIIQAGDCFALWVNKESEVAITSMQTRQLEAEADEDAERIQRRIAKEKYNLELEEVNPAQVKEIREEMWREYLPVWIETRRRYVNNPSNPHGHGLLNGQTALKEMWFHRVLERDSLETLLLFTDGLTPHWKTVKDKNDIELGRMIYSSYRKGGLKGILEDTRALDKQVKGVSWGDAAEAAAVAVEF